MTRITAIIFALALTGSAKAEPVTLRCDGEMQRVGTSIGDKDHSSHQMTVVVDWQTKTAKIEDFDVDLIPLKGGNDFAITGYAGAVDGPKFGIDLGQLNRVTGKLSADYILEAGDFRFDGVCTRKKAIGPAGADNKIMSGEEADSLFEKHYAERKEHDAQQAVKDALDAQKRGDYATAYKLLRSQKGFAHADDYLEKLKATMTPAQIAEAEKQVVIDDGIHALSNGTKEDYVHAAQLLRPLADQGDAQAEYYLGRVYLLSSPEGAVEAAKWYEKAAEQGYARAQYILGDAYREGVGVLRDVVTAHMWLNLAAAGGNQDAAQVRDELEKRMTPAQIAEAEKLAREWKPKPER